MTADNLRSTCMAYMRHFCCDIPERSVGSDGNRQATRYFHERLSALGWTTTSSSFDAIDWIDNGATLVAGDTRFSVKASPYSLGCSVQARLVSATTVRELERLDACGQILFLHGEIAKEQLMPKNFVFYNPEEHQRIVSLLEKSGAHAIICATGRNAALAGGVYPFPLIEDGDFDVPSVYMTDTEGERLMPFIGQNVVVHSSAQRIPGKGYNVIGSKGHTASQRIVLTAHIDAKKGTPGAIDNATGVTALLLVAENLKEYKGNRQLEIVAFNGEDYYAVPGQMLYVSANQDKFDSILLNINIDGAGYREGKTAFSFFGVDSTTRQIADDIMREYPGITEGIQWPQGDHSIFTQFGRPAIAVSSKWFTENINAQEVTHTPKDNLEIVDYAKIVELSQAISVLVNKL